MTPTIAIAALTTLALYGPGPGRPSHVAESKRAGAQPDEPILRNLYDLRELRGDMAEVTHDGLDDLVGTVMGQYIGVGHSELLDGVYVVEGTQSQLAEVDEMMRGFRSALGRAYVVRVECRVYPQEVDIPLGRPPSEGGGVIQWFDGTVGARRECPIQLTTTQTFINEWSPVVSDSAVGYDPQADTVTSGLAATVLIGEQNEGMVRARLVGTLQEVSLDERMVEMSGAVLPFSAPTVVHRAILADATISMGESVVVQVMPGFDPGTTMAVVIRVLPIESVFAPRSGGPARTR